MIEPSPIVSPPDPRVPRRLSRNVAALGYVSMLTAVSSAMIYGLLPVFMVQVLGISIASVGLIEGMAEAANSLVKIVSGVASDWIGRRKPLLVLGYTLSAITKTIFPIAGTALAVWAARVIDRLGKGIRDAPRDAFADQQAHRGDRAEQRRQHRGRRHRRLRQLLHVPDGEIVKLTSRNVATFAQQSFEIRLDLGGSAKVTDGHLWGRKPPDARHRH
jgi:hypothetical protein